MAVEVRKEIEIKHYCTNPNRCVRGGKCKTTYPIESETADGKRWGKGVGEKYYICPYLMMVRE